METIKALLELLVGLVLVVLVGAFTVAFLYHLLMSLGELLYAVGTVLCVVLVVGFVIGFLRF